MYDPQKKNVTANLQTSASWTLCDFPLSSAVSLDGLSSSHSVLGHSPGLVPSIKEAETPVEYGKENKRSHTDRGELGGFSFFFLLVWLNQGQCWPSNLHVTLKVKVYGNDFFQVVNLLMFSNDYFSSPINSL